MTETGRINIQGTKGRSEQEAKMSLYGKGRGERIHLGSLTAWSSHDRDYPEKKGIRGQA